MDVNSTWARLTWRRFSEFELQFIDGVQLRYKETAGKVRRDCSDVGEKKRQRREKMAVFLGWSSVLSGRY
jgi:hypothetical protein